MKIPGLKLLTASHLFIDINQGALPALLPFLIFQYHLSYEEAAGLIFAANITSSVIQPVFGYYADKIPSFFVMTLGLLFAGLGLSVVGMTNNYWLMFAGVAVSGAGIAAYHPESARIANSIAGEKKATSVSTFAAGGNIGLALGPITAVAFVTAFGMKGIMLYTLPAIFMFFVLLTQKDVLVLNKNKEEATSRIKNIVDEWSSFYKLGFVIIIRSIVIFGINTFLPLYWINVLHQPKSTSSLILTLIFLVGAMSSLVAGRVADRVGNRTVLKSGFLMLTPILLLFLQTQNVYLATLLLIPIAVSLFAIFSPMVVLGQQYLPNHMGLASGLILGLAISIGGSTIPLLSRIASAYGLEWTLTLIAVLPLLAFFATFTLPFPASLRQEKNNALCEQ